MSKPSPRVRVIAPPPVVPLGVLQQRARKLRRAMRSEPDIRGIADVFSKDIMNESALHEHSELARDPIFSALLGPEGPVSGKFPGQRFQATLFFCEPLGLYHGAVRSSAFFGFAFRFAGDAQSVIVLCRPDLRANTEFLRFTTLPEPSHGPRPVVMQRGGVC
ncbi:MAG: hypothetical protein R3B40_00860 [Polyangiales bacterium]|nr:hypothetical protein [Myxococcales bacterium]MCA9579453.1 hypothetical protein [Myxococcales bacterium]MCB9659006.1 hypothetical protein [Sandaracinaceae bacterium]